MFKATLTLLRKTYQDHPRPNSTHVDSIQHLDSFQPDFRHPSGREVRPRPVDSQKYRTAQPSSFQTEETTILPYVTSKTIYKEFPCALSTTTRLLPTPVSSCFHQKHINFENFPSRASFIQALSAKRQHLPRGSPKTLSFLHCILKCWKKISTQSKMFLGILNG